MVIIIIESFYETKKAWLVGKLDIIEENLIDLLGTLTLYRVQNSICNNFNQKL